VTVTVVYTAHIDWLSRSDVARCVASGHAVTSIAGTASAQLPTSSANYQQTYQNVNETGL